MSAAAGLAGVLGRLTALLECGGGADMVLPGEVALVGLVDEAEALARDEEDPRAVLAAAVARALLRSRRARDAGGSGRAALRVAQSFLRCL